MISALGRVLCTAMLKKLAGDPSNRDELTHVSACITASSMDLWQYLCLNISSPTPVSPNTATQCLFAKSTPLQTTSIHFIPWQLSSGMLSQSGWCACQPLMRSSKQLVSCNTPGRRSLHDAFNLFLTLLSPTFDLSSLLTTLSHPAFYLISSSFISALTAPTCLECLRRRMTVYNERKTKIHCVID